MSTKHITYQTLICELQNDVVQKRFNAKVILVNNRNTYFELVDCLSNMADLAINLSDSRICVAEDTIPDLKAALAIINANTDKNILLTSVGEYLRFGLATEMTNRTLFSLISRQAHSSKRVWIPIYAAKDEFERVVGELDEEHYPDMVVEVEDEPLGFTATVYSKKFATKPGIVSISGMRAWFELWDSAKIKSNATLATRHAKALKATEGLYTLNVITEPNQYVESRIASEVRIDPRLGSEEQWLYLASYAPKPGTPIKDAITRALNLLEFNPHQIIAGWNTASNQIKWLFWLWYKLGLNSSSDYLSYSMGLSSSYNDIAEQFECSIFSCLDNPNLDEWISQRTSIMDELGVSGYSQAFWEKFATVDDPRKQLKILSGKTHDDRTKIIEIVSNAFRTGKTIQDFKSLLSEKYPDLLMYFEMFCYGSSDLQWYINRYKHLKLQNQFSMELSESSIDINYYDFDTRSQVLNTIRANRSAYYLWIDGMGVEWIDLLIRKIAACENALQAPNVKICTAVLPTVTSVNMAFADPETVTQKINDLDTLSHIKDKADCNYYAVIEKQLEVISEIAVEVVKVASEHPDKDIVITADHGMSRLAAMGFHQTEGVKAPKNGEVYSLGRYCQFSDGCSLPDISHTVKGENVIAFKSHSHFSVPGYAPGEIHGGASPEEILVPVIHYIRQQGANMNAGNKCSYKVDKTVTLLPSGVCELLIQTKGVVNKVAVDIKAVRYQANKVGENRWIARIPNLAMNQEYPLRVYLNNLFSNIEEVIYVKNPGLTIDDDF